jgi:hypothetical protein
MEGGCIVGAAAKEVRASWSSLIIIWSYERVRASAMHVNKIRMMNDNFELLFQKVLMFEKYLLMPYDCSFIFS